MSRIGVDAQTAARRLSGRRLVFARSGIDIVARAALSKGRAQISWNVWHAALLKVKHRYRGGRSTFARSRTDFVAGAALSQGRV